MRQPPAPHGEKDKGPDGPDMAVTPLQLSEEQQQQFFEIADKERRELRGLSYKAENIMDDIHKMERAEEIDFAAYEKLVKQAMTLEAEKLVVRARTHAAIRAILSEEQLLFFPPFRGLPEAGHGIMRSPQEPRGPQGRPVLPGG